MELNGLAIRLLIDFRNESPVLEMDINDEPEQVVNIDVSCNCLFQSLAYYISGNEADYGVLRQFVILFSIKIILKKIVESLKISRQLDVIIITLYVLDH